MKIKRLLLGDEAFALGALDAGLSGAYAYPGTPSTEITEFVQNHPLTAERGIHSHWSSNEKTAYEEALGMSYCGRRSYVAMKHVGINVAADPMVNSAMTGANGGMIVVAADDPSMHSSQNEQDSRFYARFAMIPALEPSNQQEAYDMAAYGFDLSERLRLPVMMRLVTRLSHSRGVVECAPEAREQNPVRFPDDERRWVLMPVNSKVRYLQLIDDYARAEQEAENSPYNITVPGTDRRLGIITSGIAFNYLNEAFGGKCPFTVLKISQYPLPRRRIAELCDAVDTVVVVEEGQPFIEEQLRGLLDRGVKVRGKLDGTLPRTGELNPDAVIDAFAGLCPDIMPARKPVAEVPVEVVRRRPPALCQGCGHRDVYHALIDTLKKYEKPRVFGDIGCYTLGWLSPFNAIDTTVDMGASITMAKGAADAGVHPSVAIIGDSTFTHSGMTGLLDAINEDSDVLIIISDNFTTGMTGGQDSQGTGKLVEICLGLGANPDHLVTIDSLPKNYEDMKELFTQEINHRGCSIVISQRECIQTARRHASEKSKKQ